MYTPTALGMLHEVTAQQQALAGQEKWCSVYLPRRSPAEGLLVVAGDHAVTGCGAATMQAVLPERLLLLLHVLDLLNCSATSQDKLEDITYYL